MVSTRCCTKAKTKFITRKQCNGHRTLNAVLVKKVVRERPNVMGIYVFAKQVTKQSVAVDGRAISAGNQPKIVPFDLWQSEAVCGPCTKKACPLKEPSSNEGGTHKIDNGSNNVQLTRYGVDVWKSDESDEWQSECGNGGERHSGKVKESVGVHDERGGVSLGDAKSGMRGGMTIGYADGKSRGGMSIGHAVAERGDEKERGGVKGGTAEVQHLRLNGGHRYDAPAKEGADVAMRNSGDIVNTGWYGNGKESGKETVAKRKT